MIDGTIVSATLADRLSAIDCVLGHLAEYKGEPIVKDEHPIHKAVVALERLCIRTDRPGQPFKLPTPVHAAWCNMLHKSRDGTKVSWNTMPELIAEFHEGLVDMRAGLVTADPFSTPREWHEVNSKARHNRMFPNRPI